MTDPKSLVWNELAHRVRNELAVGVRFSRVPAESLEEIDRIAGDGDQGRDF